MEYEIYRDKVWQLLAQQIKDSTEFVKLIYLHTKLVSEISELMNTNSESEFLDESGDITWYQTNILTANGITSLHGLEPLGFDYALDTTLHIAIKTLDMVIKSYYHNKPFNREKYMENVKWLAISILLQHSSPTIRQMNINKLEKRHGGTNYNPAFYQGTPTI